MDIYSWSSSIPNLGDDLNHWLWKRVLPASFLSREGTFIGIGSVLHHDHLSKIKNTNPIHILGAGCRDEQYPLGQIPQEIKVHAIRGPLSLRTLRLKESLLLDAAYALQFTEEYQKVLKLPKKHQYTLIPYFKSQDIIYYTSIFDQTQVNILHASNYNSIEYAIKTIAQSKYIISESLHGAILADVLRVPWVRLKFYLQNPYDNQTAEYKWNDWLRSIEIEEINCLEIPFRIPHWISKNRNRLLKPIRTYDYYRNFKRDMNYYLSSTQLLETKSETLSSIIENLGK